MTFKSGDYVRTKPMQISRVIRGQEKVPADYEIIGDYQTHTFVEHNIEPIPIPLTKEEAVDVMHTAFCESNIGWVSFDAAASLYNALSAAGYEITRKQK